MEEFWNRILEMELKWIHAHISNRGMSEFDSEQRTLREKRNGNWKELRDEEQQTNRVSVYIGLCVDSRHINCDSNNCLAICAENQKSMKANAFHFAYVIISRLCAVPSLVWYSVSSTHSAAQPVFRIPNRWNSVRIHWPSCAFLRLQVYFIVDATNYKLKFNFIIFGWGAMLLRKNMNSV